MKFDARATTRTQTVPAPVRGLNAKDSLADMRPTDALVLTNLVCRASYVEIRKGWQSHVTGFSANVETLFPYAALSGTKKLFAAAGTGIYDVSTAGAVGAAVVSGLTSAYWSQAVVSNAAGNTLIAVNGADTGRLYDGSTWAAWAITGVASTALDFVTVWKRRVWAIEKNSFKAWYLPTDAVTGAMTSFSFTAIGFQRGGYLVALINWTIDGGQGSDDHLLAVTSEGEVAVYAGTDPASASTFALRGIYYVGKPVGRRFFAKLGGDVILLTESGVIALSKFLQSTVVDAQSQLTDRIQTRIANDVASYGSTRGWELCVYSGDNLLFVQVPGGSVGSRYQYVMNTLTGAWSKTELANVITLAVHDGALYAGHSNQVSNTWTSGTDNGSPITFDVVPAFSYFGSPTKGKRFTLGRAILQADSTPTYQTRLLRDFDQSYTFPTQTPVPLSGALWDSAIWDTDVWGGAASFFRKWYSLTGHSYAATVALRGVSNGTILRVVAFDYVYEPGDTL